MITPRTLEVIRRASSGEWPTMVAHIDLGAYILVYGVIPTDTARITFVPFTMRWDRKNSDLCRWDEYTGDDPRSVAATCVKLVDKIVRRKIIDPHNPR